jgi:hypothetical protein
MDSDAPQAIFVPQVAVAAAAAAAGLTAARLGASPEAIADAVAAAVHGASRWASPLVMPAAPAEELDVDRVGVWFKGVVDTDVAVVAVLPKAAENTKLVVEAKLAAVSQPALEAQPAEEAVLAVEAQPAEVLKLAGSLPRPPEVLGGRCLRAKPAEEAKASNVEAKLAEEAKPAVAARPAVEAKHCLDASLCPSWADLSEEVEYVLAKRKHKGRKGRCGSSKPALEAKPAEDTKPTSAMPGVKVKPAEATLPAEEAKPAELATQPAVEAKPAEEARPAEEAQPAEEEEPAAAVLRELLRLSALAPAARGEQFGDEALAAFRLFAAVAFVDDADTDDLHTKTKPS